MIPTFSKPPSKEYDANLGRVLGKELGFCGAEDPETGYHCWREKGHDGAHATMSGEHQWSCNAEQL